jgi:hypothetical protein
VKNATLHLHFPSLDTIEGVSYDDVSNLQALYLVQCTEREAIMLLLCWWVTRMPGAVLSEV